MDQIRIEVPRFHTHVKKSKNKYMKINGQRLFVGLNHHLRAHIVRQMHLHLEKYVPKDLNISHMYPIRISLEFHVPINYDNVRMINDKKSGTYKLSWKEPEKDYQPGWDADNQWIWGKCFNDTLVEMGIITKDSVAHVKCSGQVEFIPVQHIDDRKLVFIIESYNQWKKESTQP